MQFAPFLPPGASQYTTAMGADYHIIPGVHVLFFGPIECARHTFSTLVDDPDASLLVIDDVQTALGSTEDLVVEAVEEITQQDSSIRAFLFCTACQTSFMGLDLRGLCQSLHARFGLYFAFVEFNRMTPENIPGPNRKSIPGGDRLHVRKSFFRMLEQVNVEQLTAGSGGVLVLTQDALDPSCDLKQLEMIPGIDWVRSVGDLTEFDLFVQARMARAVIATSMVWKETGEYLQAQFGIPFFYLPTSYSIDEIDGYYEKLGEVLEFPEPFHAWCQGRREEALEEVQKAHETPQAHGLDLDARVINRPFSLLESLIGYGFGIGRFVPSLQNIQHKETDDIGAYRRLGMKYPVIREQFRSHATSATKKQKHGTSTRNFRKPGRFVEFRKQENVVHVPEETAWWGYSSVIELMRQLQDGRPYGVDGRFANRGPKKPTTSPADNVEPRGQWDL